MKTALFCILILSSPTLSRADFSYSNSQKMTGGMAVTMANTNRTTRTYLKGQKMKTDSGDTATIVDLDAQTITTINNAQKSYTVKKFSDLATDLPKADTNVKADVKETGEKKNVNGFNASLLNMTVQMNMNQGGRDIAMKMDMDLWISPEVPGAKEVRDFYQRNAGKFPFGALGGENPGMAQAMADMQRKIATLDGVPVQQVVRMNPVGVTAVARPAMSPEQLKQMQAQMAGMPAAARAQMEKMISAMGGGGSGALAEITIDSSDFSAAPIPDSVFGIPAGYAVK